MVKRKSSRVIVVNYTYEIKIFSTNSFLIVEKKLSNNFKYTWTDLEVGDIITGSEYYVHGRNATNSLNRIIQWLKIYYPELLL